MSQQYRKRKVEFGTHCTWYMTYRAAAVSLIPAFAVSYGVGKLAEGRIVLGRHNKSLIGIATFATCFWLYGETLFVKCLREAGAEVQIKD